MGLKFNPLTGNFDLTGSGGGGGGPAFFAGEVATYADLPLDGTAALDSRWLVRSNSGTWPFSSYKQAGVYVRKATAGVSRDNDYQLTDTSFHDVMSDAAFLLYDDGDATRNLKFQLSGISTGTTRTLTAPNASGRIQIEGQPIGNTTPAAGTFTTLTANNGTLTASAPVLDLAQTWNASGTTFTALRVNVTDTASATASELLDLEVGSNRRLAINKAGDFLFKDNTAGLTANPVIFDFGSNQYWIHFRFSGSNKFTFQQNSVFTIDGGALEVAADRVGRESGKGQVLFNTGSTATDDSVILNGRTVFPNSNVAIRNGTTGQEFRVYNTHTSATNHERLRLAWASNVAILGTEKGSGGGTARALEFRTDNTTRLTIGSAGGFTLADAQDIAVGTTTGTKIGTATTQKIGFFNATPVVQQAAVADATDAASTQARLNDLLARLRTLGLIAT